ncbi:glyoxylase-like metal-dependent hydrolase (beta-lactamase superfamily II) [Prosthecobacter fusiformis]|uniref:Glyoxylase-like metal-dependent hydrolase (Beta-lactamase superfamily II) n=1 Tax=Prosthecobacter fusiformis TaxID=48464 RepID=A0A4R7S6B6_9BACT|nr:MBL fold metallo-hydrolase [Prosthecobacter fusiformis]TDU73216.1 glyoxylase-like metal-dependent hydrolase (beta-lactamase superfamily II) [Prosthecobacter fusiformis]
MNIPLEDLFNDVISKAQRGLGYSNETLADQVGVSAAAVEATKEGATDASILMKLAAGLGLHGPSLAEMSDHAWYPEPVEMEGLAQFNTPYHDMTVNAYLVWDPATKDAAVFDTGASAKPIMDQIQTLGLNLRYLFLTHTHPDHVADIDTVQAPVILISELEPHPAAESFTPGTQWKLGGLTISSRTTCGHSKGGTTYVVEGLAKPVAIVGDAIFASSMGGGAVSFADALATNRSQIFTLADETVICPGHGPMTTVGEEKRHNPFYPEFK